MHLYCAKESKDATNRPFLLLSRLVALRQVLGLQDRHNIFPGTGLYGIRIFVRSTEYPYTVSIFSLYLQIHEYIF